MKKVNFKRVFIFLGLTFTLSWGFDWLISVTLTQAGYLKTGLLPLGMFFPAFSAMFLQLFIFKDSPIYRRNLKDQTRWVFFSYLVLTILYAVIVIIALINPACATILQGVGSILVTLWTLIVIFIYGQSGSTSFRHVGLQLGNRKWGIRFIAGTALFLLA